MAHKITVSLSLDIKDDRDILQWLERQNNRSDAIRRAIREHIDSDVTLGDIQSSLNKLIRRVGTGGFRISENEPTHITDFDEPPEAAMALAALGKQ